MDRTVAANHTIVSSTYRIFIEPLLPNLCKFCVESETKAFSLIHAISITLDNHHGPIALVTNRTNVNMNSSAIIGLLNQSRMAKQAPNHARISIVMRNGAFAVVKG